MLTSRLHRTTLSALALGALDTGGIFCAYLYAVWEALPWDLLPKEGFVLHLPYFLIFIAFWFAATIDKRLFALASSEGLGAHLFAVTKAVGNALVFCTLVMALLTNRGVEREFLLPFCLGTMIALPALRLAVRVAVASVRRSGYNLRRVLIIGANDRAAHLSEVLRSGQYYEYTIEGFLEDDPERVPVLEKTGVPFLGKIDELDRVLECRTIHEIYVCLPVRSHSQTIQHIAHRCEDADVSVRIVADLFPLRIATRRLMYVEDIPLLALSTIPESQVTLAVKRAIDFTVSSILLVAFAPLFLVIAILIKRESQGPVFFAQERVGQNQRRFMILKFRSMVVNAEDMRADLEALNEADGPVFKIRDDPRITRVGKFLRRSSLDELPQLINVWRGQMSLVGPRPPIHSEVVQYTWDQRRRLSVRPGMTGLWQVSGRSDVSFKEWVEMDLAYIDSWSLLQDFIILFKTFRVVVQGRGAA